MTEERRNLLSVTGAAGRTLVINELPESARFVVDDVTEGRRLGDLNGDLMPFVIEIEGALFIVFAGVVLGPGADRVAIASPEGLDTTCHVVNQAWMTSPAPFVDGMTVTATWWQHDRMLFARRSERLTAGALEPMFGPGWTAYAPL